MTRGEWERALRANRLSAAAAPPNAGEWFNYGAIAVLANFPREALTALRKFDPYSPAVRGWFGYWVTVTSAHHMLGDHTAELREARRGRRQYPNLGAMLSLEVRALGALGRVDELLNLVEEGITLPVQAGWSPASMMLEAARELSAHGQSATAMRIYDRVVRSYDTWFAPERTTERGRHSLGSALAYAGRLRESRSIFEALSSEFPDNVVYPGNLGVLAARLGERDDALRISEQLAETEQPYLRGANTAWRARIAAVLGERERAVSLLSAAFGEGTTFGTWLHTDPDLESLRDYRPFQALMRPKG
jgi:tetratricopeptide (TPR) repeat protein